MKASIDELITKGHKEIWLNVQAENFAKELYKEFGFVNRQISDEFKGYDINVLTKFGTINIFNGGRISLN